MEQRLNRDYLSPCLIERAIAVTLIAVGIGIAVALAAWGFRARRDASVAVMQDRPIVVPQQEPMKTPSIDGKPWTEEKPADAIRRHVTVFSNLTHHSGTVTTGWIYRDGAGRVPTKQYCYYSTPNADHSKTRVDIASDRKRLPNVNRLLVPDLEEALAKCQWWN